MGIEINHKCDNCKNNLTEGDSIYCSGCYEETIDTIAKLEDRIKDLERELNNLPKE